MNPIALVAAYCALIVGASLLGGWLPTRVRLTHTRMQVTISFVGGLMLGVALLHMIPHAASYAHSLDQALAWTLGGLLLMFFLIRLFHFHDHASAEHEREHGSGEAHEHGRAHHLSWVGVAVGLALHTAIDGVALGASVVAESHSAGTVVFAGAGTFLAVLLHKPLDALAITSVMAASGRSSRLRMLVNLAFAMMCPIGALLFYLGVGGAPGPAVGCALGFSAGVFLCISLADLLPEVQFHRHDRLKLSAALLAGIAVAWAIGLLEHAGHDHPDQSPTVEQHDHG